MFKSRKARSLTAAACLAGSACASGPQVRPPPEGWDCPPGTRDTYERLGIRRGWEVIAIVYPVPYDSTPVTEGPFTAQLQEDIGALPSYSLVFGQRYAGSDRVYARITQAQLPDGEIVPVCFEMAFDGLGVPLHEDSTPGNPMMSYLVPLVAIF